ncbi:class I SAM-dependent methyltransferase [Rhodoblastus sp.]|uniref:class I SAM-dependent methyltransferase n=1 Tax=Rhodoblastus sp. TaxID=1962975 RepID=UPI0025EEF36A|nr:class I SAM-dependent methyltransferase [Rhodoblastus sp.]
MENDGENETLRNPTQNGDTVERLHFDAPGAVFHAYTAAQHAVRYASVREIVAGCRVLDIACGEGYGAELMSRWGARHVIGLDCSAEAIAAARKRFGGEGREFRVGNAELADELLKDELPFDVIVSFETIEHLRDPERFLTSIAHLRGQNTVIAISCPNDETIIGDSAPNLHHLHRYTFEEFRRLCEDRLGQAARWFVGAPVAGEMNVVLNDPRVFSGATDAGALLDLQPMDNVFVMPSQANAAVSRENCSHYLGLWECDAVVNAVLAAQSLPSFLEPWRAVEWLKSELAGAQRQIQALQDEQRTSQVRFDTQFADQSAQLQDLLKLKNEWYEPELLRRSAELEAARARALHYAEKLNQANAEFATAKDFLESRFAKIWRANPPMFERRTFRRFTKILSWFYRP